MFSGLRLPQDNKKIHSNNNKNFHDINKHSYKKPKTASLETATKNAGNMINPSNKNSNKEHKEYLPPKR
jgi:hypothetical protein